MLKRILLAHADLPLAAPIDQALKRIWPARKLSIRSMNRFLAWKMDGRSPFMSAGHLALVRVAAACSGNNPLNATTQPPIR